MSCHAATNTQSSFFHWYRLDVELGYLSDMHEKYSKEKMSNQMPAREYLGAVLLLKRGLKKLRTELCHRFDVAYRFPLELRDEYN